MGQKELFENYLHQALIEVDVSVELLDLVGDLQFQNGGNYVQSGSVKAYYKDLSMAPPGFQVLQEYVYAQLKEKLKNATPLDEHKYDVHFKAVYLGEPGGSVSLSGTINGLNGYSNGKYVVLFPTKNDQTAAHEFLHSFNLPHSFTNNEASSNALFTYEYAKTENIMDYSHFVSQMRYSLWQWQWKKANDSII